jgi:hypothetical protein
MKTQTGQSIIALNSELKTVAETMRDREDEILALQSNLRGNIIELSKLAIEQGQSLLLVEARLPKSVNLDQWIKSHVPQMPTERAGKYKRAAKESLDQSQTIFIFVDRTQNKNIGFKQEIERAPAKMWERAWGYLTKFKRDVQPNEWPREKIELTRQELTPTIEALGGKVVWR